MALEGGCFKPSRVGFNAGGTTSKQYPIRIEGTFVPLSGGRRRYMPARMIILYNQALALEGVWGAPYGESLQGYLSAGGLVPLDGTFGCGSPSTGFRAYSPAGWFLPLLNSRGCLKITLICMYDPAGGFTYRVSL